MLDSVGHSLGFWADTGIWSGPSKYQNLKDLFLRSELCHAKAHFGPGLVIDGEDFKACLNSAVAAKYTRPQTLAFEDEGDEWRGLEIERSFVKKQV